MLTCSGESYWLQQFSIGRTRKTNIFLDKYELYFQQDYLLVVTQPADTMYRFSMFTSAPAEKNHTKLREIVANVCQQIETPSFKMWYHRQGIAISDYKVGVAGVKKQLTLSKLINCFSSFFLLQKMIFNIFFQCSN